MERTLDDLMHDIAEGRQDFVSDEQFRSSLGLDEEWDWGDVEAMVEAGEITLADVEAAIHRSLR